MKLKQISKKYKLERLVFGSAALTAVILLLFTVVPIHYSTPLVSATDDENVDPAITVVTTNNTAAIDLGLVNPSGTFAESGADDKILFSVSSTNVTGYSLSVSTGNGTTLSNDESEFQSINSPLTASEFDTSAHNNQWGFKPNKYADLSTSTVVDNTGNDAVFLPASTSARLLDKTTAPNSAANDYSITIGMRADLNTNPGDYDNTLDLVVVSNLVPAYTQTTKYRLENLDGTFTDWITSEEVSVKLGETYSWDSSKIEGFDNTPFEYEPINYMVTDDHINEVTFMRHVYTITKRYKLGDADDNYPDEFTNDGTLTIRHGDSYTYHKCVDYYNCKDNEITDITEDTTLDVLLDRRQYPVYVQAGTDIKSVTGGGTYRWGQIITLTASRNDDNNCRVYHGETWTRNGYGYYVNDLNSGNTVQFVVGKGTATLRANATHDDIPQTITFSAPNGETLFFDDVEYHDGETTQAICGNHSISATLKEVPMEDRIYLQDITPETCPTTKTRVYDRRDEESYYIQKLADGNCWMQDNLRLDSATSVPLTTANTNMSPVYNFELPEGWPLNSGYSYSTSVLPRTTTAHKERGLAPWWTAEAGSFADAQWRNTTFTVEDSTTLTFQEVSRVGVYYNFCAVTAGTWCPDPQTGEQPEGFVDDGHVYDICPAGWRLPVSGLDDNNEYRELRLAYNDNDTFLDMTNTRLGSGMVNEVNTVWHQTSIGYYWSGTPRGTLYGFFLSTWRSDSSINVQMSAERTVGHAARCMMKTPEEP